jgi:hypothetical protein
MVEIIKDVNIMDEISKYDTVLIGTNVYCTLSQGVQRDIALNYSYAREKNFQTKYGDVSKLGKILECTCENEPTIVLLYMYRGYPYRKKMDEDYLDYNALEKCLKEVNKKYKNKTLATTLLGCSRFDGHGDRDKVIDIMNKTLTDVHVVVYDFFQKSRDEKQIETRKRELAIKAVDYKLYYETVKKRKEEAEKRFKKNGFARY